MILISVLIAPVHQVFDVLFAAVDGDQDVGQLRKQPVEARPQRGTRLVERLPALELLR
jgi:hypothetical protein